MEQIRKSTKNRKDPGKQSKDLKSLGINTRKVLVCLTHGTKTTRRGEHKLYTREERGTTEMVKPISALQTIKQAGNTKA